MKAEITSRSRFGVGSTAMVEQAWTPSGKSFLTVAKPEAPEFANRSLRACAEYVSALKGRYGQGTEYRALLFYRGKPIKRVEFYLHGELKGSREPWNACEAIAALQGGLEYGYTIVVETE